MKELYTNITMDFDEKQPTGITNFVFYSPDWICTINVRLNPQQLLAFKEQLDQYIEDTKATFEEL